jgi:hypothetical protein
MLDHAVSISLFVGPSISVSRHIRGLTLKVLLKYFCVRRMSSLRMLNPALLGLLTPPPQVPSMENLANPISCMNFTCTSTQVRSQEFAA